MLINDPEHFRQTAHAFVDWMADFYADIRQRPVKSPMRPGELLRQLPEAPPPHSEDMAEIFADFERLVLPGITHWQHPNFHAYFPANGSYPSLLAEMLTAALGAQCMVWETSPAAAELEERMMDWLKTLCGLPAAWHGVIQDTASAATLCAILSARERCTDFAANRQGLAGQPVLRVYCSAETHSSIEKATKIAGLGRENLVLIPVDERQALRPDALRAAIAADRAAGWLPACVVATLGSTGTTAFDPLPAIADICQREGLWLHVDAAYAGTAFALPECRHWAEGLEAADSYVFNPHKWMFTHFDCSAYYVRDKAQLIRTFSILPEYLKTAVDDTVNNYRDWGIALGRRFRALKLWFVLRQYGSEGIRQRLREHLALAAEWEAHIAAHPRFELLAPRTLNLLCFRLRPEGMGDDAALDAANSALLQHLNASGQAYLSHTKVQGRYCLRMVIGQSYVRPEDVARTWASLEASARALGFL